MYVYFIDTFLDVSWSSAMPSTSVFLINLGFVGSGDWLMK